MTTDHEHDFIHSQGVTGTLDFCWDCNFTQLCTKPFPDCEYCVDLPMRPRGLEKAGEDK